MPGYDDRARAKPAKERASDLVASAEDLVKNKWFGRSWTEVGWSVIGRAGSGGKWVAGQGLKVGINNVAGMFGPVAQWATGKELNELAGNVASTVIEQVWPLVEDRIKEKMEEGSMAVVDSRFPTVTAPISSRLRQELKEKEPKEKVEKLQNTISELCVRSATLSKRLDDGKFAYCDDAYYCALEMVQIEALRVETLGLINSLKADLDALNDAVNQLDMDTLKREITKVAENVTADNSPVPHNNHYRFNVIAGAKSCSLQHCYGKQP
jgi:hypothetical protein